MILSIFNYRFESTQHVGEAGVTGAWSVPQAAGRQEFYFASSLTKSYRRSTFYYSRSITPKRVTSGGSLLTSAA